MSVPEPESTVTIQLSQLYRFQERRSNVVTRTATVRASTHTATYRVGHFFQGQLPSARVCLHTSTVTLSLDSDTTHPLTL